jgi:glutathione S-transferase
VLILALVLVVWLVLFFACACAQIQGLAVQRVFKKFWGQPADEDAVKGHVERVTPAFDVMEKHLSDPKFPFLAGEQFSLADVFFYPYVHLLTKGPEASIITSRPHVHAWWQRISARPAWQKAIAAAEKEQASSGKK